MSAPAQQPARVVLEAHLEHRANATALLDAYRDEIRRETAAEQRTALLDEGYDLSCRCDSCTACLVRYAITAIDPGTDYYEDVQ